MEEIDLYNKRINLKYRAPFWDFKLEFDFSRDMFEDEKCEVMIRFEKVRKKLKIKYCEFNKLFQKLANINYCQVIITSGAWGRDGSDLDIYLEYASNCLSVHIWAHECEIETRGLTEINNIFNEILEMFDIDKEKLFNYNYDNLIKNKNDIEKSIKNIKKSKYFA